MKNLSRPATENLRLAQTTSIFLEMGNEKSPSGSLPVKAGDIWPVREANHPIWGPTEPLLSAR